MARWQWVMNLDGSGQQQVWSILRYYYTFYIYVIEKNREVAGHCGYSAHNSFEWHDWAVSWVETYGSHYSTTQNAYVVGLRGIHNKQQ